MMAQPRSARWPDTVNAIDGSRAPPEVGVVMHDPPPAAVLVFGGATAADHQVADHVEQRLMALAEVGQFRRPVIHLAVDIEGPLALPRRIEQFVPDAL